MMIQPVHLVLLGNILMLQTFVLNVLPLVIVEALFIAVNVNPVPTGITLEAVQPALVSVSATMRNIVPVVRVIPTTRTLIQVDAIVVPHIVNVLGQSTAPAAS